MDNDNDGRNESPSGSNAAGSGTPTRTYRPSGSLDNGGNGIVADAARRENAPTNEGSAPGSDTGKRDSNSGGDSSGTGSNGNGSGRTTGRSDWRERLNKWRNAPRTGVSSGGGNETQAKAGADENASALNVEFGEAKPPKKLKTSWSSGRTVGNKIYGSAAKILVTGPFWLARIWTHYEGWLITDAEWKELQPSATSLAEKHLPVHWAQNISDAGDVIVLAQALTGIYDKKREEYRLAKVAAEQRADDIARQFASNNGYDPNAEDTLSRILPRY